MSYKYSPHLIKTLFFGFLLLFIPILVSAACTDLPDEVTLLDKSNRITTSEYILVSQNENSINTLDSICIKGTCYSNHFYGSNKKINLYKIPQISVLHQIDAALIDAQIEMHAKHPNDFNYYINNLLINKEDLSKALLSNIDQYEKIPFYDPSTLQYNPSNCFYHRHIKYDVSTYST